jgi:hypothetical protein
MHMLRDLKPFFLLATITVFSSVFAMIPDRAIAVPTNQIRGCLGDTFVNTDGTVQDDYLTAFVLDGRNSAINVRERPSTDSPIRYVATSRIGISGSRQIIGEDNYCWLQVEGDVWDGNRRTDHFTGWVRGDLVGMEI